MKTTQLLYAMRAYDNYQSEELKQTLIDTFYPDNDTELIQGLSQVTSAFYGFLLEKSKKLHGPNSIDQLSKELFYELGRSKTVQALQKMNDLPVDSRAIAIVLVSAIFNASPEYTFTIHAFSPDHTIIELTGIDRYYRICSTLQITHLLTWPVLIPFVQAIHDTLHLNCSIHAELKQLEANGETKCMYEFKTKA